MAGPPSAPPPAARPRRGIAQIFAVLVLSVWGGVFACAPALAQATFTPIPPPPAKTGAALKRAGQPQMLMKAARINYDYANHLVSAVGDVQIYYKASTLEANKVVYNQQTKRLHAEGNVRLEEADGKVTHGQVIDLSDDYRNGFVDALRLNTPQRTTMAAARAERTAGNFTVFHNGVYTACAPCKDNPKAPPEWQVKAKRIIHDQQEKMMYFEDSRLEFWGVPLFWMPYFSAPDPTVKRKTGLLMPSVSSSSVYGAAVEVPYYFALAPNYDVTVAPKYTSRQGLLMQGEFRHRLLDGAYMIRGAGIRQQDPSAFNGSFGDRDWRGSVESAGRFAINKQWVWGWDALLLSDRYFLQDYNPSLSKYSHPARQPVGDQRGHFAGLHRRPRQPQLFRRPLDLLPRLLGRRRAGPDPDHPPGDRLHLHVRPPRCSAAKSATTSISPACRARRPTSTRSRKPRTIRAPATRPIRR